MAVRRKSKSRRNKASSQLKSAQWLQAGAVAAGVSAAVVSGAGSASATTGTESGPAGATTSVSAPGAVGSPGASVSPDSRKPGLLRGRLDGHRLTRLPKLPATVTDSKIAEDPVGNQRTPRVPVFRPAGHRSSDRIAAPAVELASEAPSPFVRQRGGANSIPAIPPAPVIRLHPSLTAGLQVPTPMRLRQAAARARAQVPVPAPSLPAKAAAAPSVASAPTKVVLALFSLVGFHPDRTQPPGAPPPMPRPVLELAWSAWRRIDGRLFNSTPVLMPTVPSSSDAKSGVVTGDLGATDANGDALKFIVVDKPQHGEVKIAEDGTYVYTPDKAWAHNTGGTDEFTVHATDDTELHLHLFSGTDPAEATKTITLTVTPTNTAPVVTPVISGPDPVTGKVVITLRSTDEDGDTIEYAIKDAPDYGDLGPLVTTAEGSSYTYTPRPLRHDVPQGDSDTAGPPALDTITITATDGHGGVTPATFTVKADLVPVNEKPSDYYTYGWDTAEIRGFTHVKDPDGDTLTYKIDTGPAKGAATVDKLGQWSYIPTPEARMKAVALGATEADQYDTFTIVASDGFASTVVTVKAPVLQPDNLVIDEIAIPVYGNPQDVAFTPDGTRVYVLSPTASTLTVIDAATRKVIKEIPVGDDASRIEFSPDGKFAYTSNYGDKSVSVIDTDPASATYNQVVDEIEVGNQPLGLAVTPDGKHVYVLNYQDGTVSEIGTDPSNTATYRKAGTPIPVGDLYSWGIAATDRYVYIPSAFVPNTLDNYGGQLPVAINVATGQVEPFLFGGGADFQYLTVSHGGPSDPVTVYVVSTDRNEVLAISEKPKSPTTSDIIQVLVTDDQGNQSNLEIKLGANKSPHAIVASPNDNRLYVVNSADDTVSVIDTDVASVTYRQVVAVIPLPEPQNPYAGGDQSPYGIDISPDGSRLYVANSVGASVTVISVLPHRTNGVGGNGPV